MSHDQYLDHLRREIARLAREILEDRMHPIEGIREIARHCHQIDAQDDEDFIALRSIESETDHLPLGDLRARCEPEYLARRDAELEDYLAAVWPELKAGCERIVERFA